MDTFRTDKITCPYCGYQLEDSWEITSDSGNLQCDNCDKIFFYERVIDISYTTIKKNLVEK